MLVIRETQSRTFTDAAAQRFEDQTVEHCRRFSPPLCRAAGEEGVRQTIRRAMAAGPRYGFDGQTLVRFYVELMFTLGADFHDDPQLPWVQESLRPSPIYSVHVRASQLYQDLTVYLNRVAGWHNVLAVAVLRRLSQLPDSWLATADWSGELRRSLQEIYPEKSGEVSAAALRQIFDRAGHSADEYGLPATGGPMLLAVLMLAFGHGVANDPLYPWVADTLADPRLPSPAARLERLTGKVRTYAAHALAHLEETS